MNHAGSDVQEFFDGEFLSTRVYQDVFQTESLEKALQRWPLLAALQAASHPSHAGDVLEAMTDNSRGGASEGGSPGSRKPQVGPRPAGHASPPLKLHLSEVPACLILAILGPKGGVGRTTCAATLGMALAYAGADVVLIDLDSQNGLSGHFSSVTTAARSGGLVNASRLSQNWRGALCSVALKDLEPGGTGRLRLLPYGHLSDGASEILTAQASVNADWLIAGLTSLDLSPGALVILDLPAQPSCITRKALAAAHFTIAVMQADAASLLLADRTRAMIDDSCIAANGFARPLYVINQLNHGHRLDHDVSRVLRRRYGTQVVGMIHRDQAVGEALAHGTTVLESAPDSQASLDFRHCAREFMTVVDAHYALSGLETATA